MSYHQARWEEPAIWDLAHAYVAEPAPAVPGVPERFRRKEALRWPELSEPTVVRHYTRLSQMNYGIDTGVYPLGSCTMKYNPKLSELLARRPGPRRSTRTSPKRRSRARWRSPGGSSGCWPRSPAIPRSRCSRRPARTGSTARC